MGSPLGARPRRLIGHGEPVGNAFQDVDAGDRAVAVDDPGDGALLKVTGGTDTPLTGAGELAQQPKQATHVPPIEGLVDLLTSPEIRLDSQWLQPAHPTSNPASCEIKHTKTIRFRRESPRGNHDIASRHVITPGRRSIVTCQVSRAPTDRTVVSRWEDAPLRRRPRFTAASTANQGRTRRV
jgi:hypothetical protein